MACDYHIDLESITLDELRTILETGRLLPSEAILKEDLAGRFAVLESMGIRNLQELSEALKTKKRLQQFAQESGLPAEYLTVLRRRAGSYAPKPIPIRKLIGPDPDHVERLAQEGVKDTQQLFDRAKSVPDRAALADQAHIPEGAMLELVKLSDLARPPYVGPAFARLLLESGVDTIAKLAAQTPEGLYRVLVATKAQTGTYRAPIPGVEDMASWLATVRRLPQVVEYP
jgi:hypothetical protein